MEPVPEGSQEQVEQEVNEPAYVPASQILKQADVKQAINAKILASNLVISAQSLLMKMTKNQENRGFIDKDQLAAIDKLLLLAERAADIGYRAGWGTESEKHKDKP